MALVAMAIIPSVVAEDYKNWGDDYNGKGPDNRFIVGNWKQRNEGRRDIESPLTLFRKRSNLPTVKIAGENLTEPVRIRANETEGNWGEYAGEGVNNCFQIGRLTRNDIADEDRPENGNDEEQMLELSFHRMSRYAALLTAPTSMVCGNSFDSPKGCSVALKILAGEAYSNFSCYCNVTINPRVASVDCCHYACCNHIIHITNVVCGKTSRLYDCDVASVFVQDPCIVVTTESTIATESTTINTLDSTTVADGGSTPNGEDHVLGTIAAAILIVIHIRGQAQFP